MKNSCNNDVYEVKTLDLFKRFLMLGCEGGTYYISESNLIEKHVASLERLLGDSSSHDSILNTIKEYSKRSYKKENLLYALARCCCFPSIRERAYALLEDVCITPTHIFAFVCFYEGLYKIHNNSTGWNKLQKDAISSWYLSKDPLRLAYLVTKYKQRNGWTHKDLLRLAHPKTDTLHSHVFKYVTSGLEGFLKKENPDEKLTEYIKDYESLKSTKDYVLAIELIKKHGFVREQVPTCLLDNMDVWNELAKKMPAVALLRSLNKLSSLFDVYPDTKKQIFNRLMSENLGVHPLQILVALKTYSGGVGLKSNRMWRVDELLCNALNYAFRNSFKDIVPTNKRYLLALDISASMAGSKVCGIENMTASEISTAMAMIMASVEKQCDIMGFAEKFKDLGIKPDASLEDNMKKTRSMNFGSTDCSLPMSWSIENKKLYDAIIIFTDSETNCNSEVPSEMLKRYREHSKTNCKLVVVAMAGNMFSIADPEDPFGMIDVAGFDIETPNVIRDFVALP